MSFAEGPPITRSSFRTAMDRFGVEGRGVTEAARIASPWLLPTVSVGQDYSDRERPLWGIRGFQPSVLGQYSTVSITSAFDIAIHEIRASVTSTAPEELFLLTPPASWVPFLNGTTAYPAGIRPRTSFDSGNSLVLAGSNPAAPPFAGVSMIQAGGYGQNFGQGINPQTIQYIDGVTGLIFTYVRHTGGASGAPFFFRQDTVWRPPRPLILPTPMFFTVSSSATSRILVASFTYSELGGGALI